MRTGIRILRAGPGVTLQDGGRWGYLRYGITPAGPMDPQGFRFANLAAGVDPIAPAIEISLGGLEIEAQGDPFGVALAGGDFIVRLNGSPLTSCGVIPLACGNHLAIRAGASGAWSYLSFTGRIDAPAILGSHATHCRSGLGGLQGRALRAGDFIPLMNASLPMHMSLSPPLYRRQARLRILWGSQETYFSQETREQFLTTRWRISARSDRMAYALEGPPLAHKRGFNLLSDGVAMGAIQIPGDGLPLVLMADRAPTGGYPKIAHIIGADLGAFAQHRPGDGVYFKSVSHEEAVAALRALRSEHPDQAENILLRLTGHNLIDGVISATDDKI